MNYLHSLVINDYTIFKDYIELHHTCGVVMLTNENDIADVLRWIKEAKQINVDACKYISYMIRENW